MQNFHLSLLINSSIISISIKCNFKRSNQAGVSRCTNYDYLAICGEIP